MVLGMDIGGTKVLLGVFDANGKLTETLKFETPPIYKDFLNTLSKKFLELKTKNLSRIVADVPARLDHEKGMAISFGNLSWKNVPIRDDISKLLKLPVMIENDAKTGALAAAHEAGLLNQKVLYVTVGTGIGTGVVVNGRLDDQLIDSEGGHILLPFEGKLQTWESFASGKAIVSRFGKKAMDITSEKDWQAIGESLGLGIIDLCAVIQPDTVIIGGGVGKHFDKFDEYLRKYVSTNKDDLIKMPNIIGAVEAEETALKGCYIYAQQHQS